MKKSLIILSLMGLSATQVNATVQQTFEPATSSPSVKTYKVVNSYSNISSNTSERVQNIEYLSNQAQQKSDELAQLARQLESRYSTSTSFATSANTPSFSSGRLDSSAPPALAAARAARAAHSRTLGLCARYVRQALQSAGYSFTPNNSAYQYATRGT